MTCFFLYHLYKEIIFWNPKKVGFLGPVALKAIGFFLHPPVDFIGHVLALEESWTLTFRV